AQEAREAAEAANRVKDEFLAVVSHELRTPLNPILGWSQLLQRGQLNEQKTAKAFEVIVRNAQAQAQLIDDLLDVSRILRGKLSLQREDVDLALVTRAALETGRLAAEAKSIEIHEQLATATVIGDVGRLQQIIWNLISNAVKFTPAGGRIEVGLQCQAAQALISIRDTGKGIPPEFLPYVFDRFRQEDSATTRQFGGLGLGLAIVRNLVELHGGTIDVDSPGEGQGATFTVALPLMPHPTETRSKPTRSQPSLNLSGLQLVVVDDETDTRDFLTFLLEQAGASVKSFAAARTALAALTNNPPDILISDIGMPDMDGYMLMQQIRALPAEQGGQIAAIALTAYASELDYQRAMDVGFQQHLKKPVEPNTLIEAIVQLVQLKH
ncbi:MAG: ATP-binding protein, partial [Thermosynechococcaceae cyanobacterium]